MFDPVTAIIGAGTLGAAAIPDRRDDPMTCLWAIVAILLLPAVAFPATLYMGPGKTYTNIQAAANAAADGDIIEVDAGTYTDQTATISRNLTIRGVGVGRAHFQNTSTYIQKGIFVVSNGNPPSSRITVTFDNVEISGSGNGGSETNAGAIRVEFQNLVLNNCYIHNNNEGVMTSSDKAGFPATSVTIRNSEFASNGYGDGYTHGMYIGTIGTFMLEGSYVHHTTEGHNVKSRAQKNYIRYNRIMDESAGTSSFLIDIPQGGETYIIGNLLHKGPNSANINVINYNEESIGMGFNTSQILYVVNNTIVNERAGGTPIRIVEQRYGTADGSPNPTTTLIQNNIVVSSPTYTLFYGNGVPTYTTNLTTTTSPGLVSMSTYDYNLTSSATGAINQGTAPGTSSTGVSLAPAYQYVHPLSYSYRTSVGTIDIGANEYTRDAIPPKAPSLLWVQ